MPSWLNLENAISALIILPLLLIGVVAKAASLGAPGRFRQRFKELFWPIARVMLAMTAAAGCGLLAYLGLYALGVTDLPWFQTLARWTVILVFGGFVLGIAGYGIYSLITDPRSLMRQYMSDDPEVHEDTEFAVLKLHLLWIGGALAGTTLSITSGSVIPAVICAAVLWFGVRSAVRAVRANQEWHRHHPGIARGPER